jgi:predicted Fe-S protein YdhL (DUF1289 family)
LDGHDICIGCLRSRDEIAAWSQMSDTEKSAVNVMLASRQTAYRRVPALPAASAESPANPVEFYE